MTEISSETCQFYLEKRGRCEVLANNAYDLAHELQRVYNEIDEAVERYDQEQRALDI